MKSLAYVSSPNTKAVKHQVGEIAFMHERQMGRLEFH